MRNEDLITYTKDFPKKGVNFIDFQHQLRHSMTDATQDLIDLLSAKEIEEADYILGVESRGFILASAMAVMLNKGFVMARKPGKLPPPVAKIDYETEYSTDSIEISPIEKGKKVIIVDDVLATGGTLKAVNRLVEQMGVEVLTNLVIFNIEEINNFDNARAVRCIK